MIIQSKRVWLQEQWASVQIEILDQRIERILAYNQEPVDVDYGNLRIYPGFMDTHLHGVKGVDATDANADTLMKIAKELPKEGITGFCLTTVTQSEAVLMKALRECALAIKNQSEGSQMLGIHFEGPYLNKIYKGAQPEPYIVDADLEQFKRYQAAAEGNIKIITMAPEKDKDFTLTRYCAQNGVCVNIGHSDSTYETALLASANGAKSMTHTFNAMSPLHHRKAGLVGAAMRLSNVYAEVIGDGNHVSWPAVNILAKTKGKDHLVLVSDSLCAKGMPEGEFELGGQILDIHANGGAYLHHTETLAGSTMVYNHGLRNLIQKAELQEVIAINACTINPAKILQLDHRKGLIKAAYDADITILDDNYDVVSTMIMGKVVYNR